MSARSVEGLAWMCHTRGPIDRSLSIDRNLPPQQRRRYRRPAQLAAPAFSAAMPTSPEPEARSMTRLPTDHFGMVKHMAGQRLTTGPGKGPEGRRQSDLPQFVLGLLPQRHGLMRQMQPHLRHQRRRHNRGIGADETARSGGSRLQRRPACRCASTPQPSPAAPKAASS